MVIECVTDLFINKVNETLVPCIIWTNFIEYYKSSSKMIYMEHYETLPGNVKRGWSSSRSGDRSIVYEYNQFENAYHKRET